MTVIAWDGRTVAADSMITVGDLRVGNVEKVVLKRYSDKSVLYASTGPAGWLDAWIAWVEAGEIPNDRPWTALPPHKTGQFIRIADGVAESMTPEHPYWTCCDVLDAWGAGADVAIGSMQALADLGMTNAVALNAVNVAIRRSIACGGYATVWYVQHPEDFEGKPLERCICPECHRHFTDTGEADADGNVYPVDYADVLGDRPEVMAPPMSTLHLPADPQSLTLRNTGHEFTELNTRGFETKEDAVHALKLALLSHLGNNPGKVYWRVKPEVGYVRNFDTKEYCWKGYARLVCVPDTLFIKEATAAIAEHGAVVTLTTYTPAEGVEMSVIPAEKCIDDGLYEQKHAQAVVNVAAGIREHMERMTKLVRERHEEKAATAQLGMASGTDGLTGLERRALRRYGEGTRPNGRG